jgi:hypothetical protein
MSRAAQLYREMQEDARIDRERELQPVREAEAELNRVHSLLNAEENIAATRALRTRLCTQPSEDFGWKKYAGNDSPEQIQRKVLAAEAEHTKSSRLPEGDRKVLIAFAQANWNLGYDLTDPSIWSCMFAKLCELLEPKKVPVQVSTPAPAPEPEKSLEEQVIFEMLSSELWSRFAQSLADGAQKVLDTATQTAFLKWLMPRSRQYQPFSVKSLRKAAKAYFGDIGELSEQEKADISLHQAFETPGTTARQSLEIVGVNLVNDGARSADFRRIG